jgi:hypothetical protein
MGFDIRLEDERGELVESVGDPTNILPKLLPLPEDDSFSCLRYIDRYGDTVFNQRQIGDFLLELKRIRKKTITGPEMDLLDAIKKLAERCRAELHLYLKFYGE